MYFRLELNEQVVLKCYCDQPQPSPAPPSPHTHTSSIYQLFQQLDEGHQKQKEELSQELLEVKVSVYIPGTCVTIVSSPALGAGTSRAGNETSVTIDTSVPV